MRREGASFYLYRSKSGAVVRSRTNEGAAKVADGSANVAGATTIAADRLRSFIERVERLEEEKAAITNDVKEVYAEAKGEGYDVKTMRQVVKLRKMDRADRQEQEALLELYLSAIGEA